MATLTSPGRGNVIASTRRSLTIVFVSFAISVLGCSSHQPTFESHATASESDLILRRAFEQHSDKLQVEGEGIVKRVLSDDNDGSKHQRFILLLGSGQTLFVAHNIDIAPRISGLQEGDKVLFRGEYDWNPEGGVIHWTHHDPNGRHSGGWLKHEGKTYQ
jgi:Protein of unknown function (DUF3465)